MLTIEQQIAERARRITEAPLTNLHMFIDEVMLFETFGMLSKDAAPGVDRQTWADYNEHLGANIEALLSAFKSGRYRAPSIRRTYIPKEDGSQRPLGIPTIEDKLLQTALSRVLTPIYEQLFYEDSYGFRPGKSQHQALGDVFQQVSFKGMRYVIDADMQNYFGTINHGSLREMLDLRIRDKVTRRMIDKWLKAGILEEGQLSYPKEGTPQGGSISPLLSNIYLHYVVDEWFNEQIRPRLKAKAKLVRFADDFLLLFANKEDAERVMKVLPKRLSRFGLKLHPEKTRLVNLEPGQTKPATFDFLGFTHYMGRSRKGRRVLKRKTARKKLKTSLQRMEQWIKSNRYLPLEILMQRLDRKMRGHYNYYGITFNTRSIAGYRRRIERMLYKWLNRRGGKSIWNWEKINQLTHQWHPLSKPVIYHKAVNP